MTENTLKRLTGFVVVLVCTGNTCRSPMAEVMCRQLIAKRLGCKVEQLEERGVLVISAGIAAMAGAGASPEAVVVMAERGLDLSHHIAQPVGDRLIRHADVILTMTNGHRGALLSQWPEATARTFVLSPDGMDISDPIGGPTELYQQCADQILAALEQRISEMELPAEGETS